MGVSQTPGSRSQPLQAAPRRAPCCHLPAGRKGKRKLLPLCRARGAASSPNYGCLTGGEARQHHACSQPPSRRCRGTKTLLAALLWRGGRVLTAGREQQSRGFLLPARNSDRSVSKARCQDVSGCPRFCPKQKPQSKRCTCGTSPDRQARCAKCKSSPHSSRIKQPKKHPHGHLSPLPAACCRAFWMLWDPGSGGEGEERDLCHELAEAAACGLSAHSRSSSTIRWLLVPATSLR